MQDMGSRLAGADPQSDSAAPRQLQRVRRAGCASRWSRPRPHPRRADHDRSSRRHAVERPSYDRIEAIRSTPEAVKEQSSNPAVAMEVQEAPEATVRHPEADPSPVIDPPAPGQPTPAPDPNPSPDSPDPEPDRDPHPGPP